MFDTFRKKIEALSDSINEAVVEGVVSKTACPVFVGGIKYPSLFDASFDSGIRSVSIWKAIKKHGGGPVQIRKTLVVMESWVTDRADNVKRYYQL